jgi:hypothetical protein
VIGFSSDSDAEPESSIDRAEQLPEISPLMFSRPSATGNDRPTLAPATAGAPEAFSGKSEEWAGYGEEEGA